MKFRAFCFGLMALMCLASGCMPYRGHPCWGFRLHPCQTPGACSSPVSVHRPILHHRQHVAPGCPTCITGGPLGGPIMTQPVAYPPVIGNPIPLPGPTITPELHMPNPMPAKPGS